MDVLIIQIIYAGVSLAMVLWITQVIFQKGRKFLLEIFQGDNTLAMNVNRLARLGILLINIGYILLHLSFPDTMSPSDVVVVVGKKLGWNMVILGVLQLINLSFLFIAFKLSKFSVDEYFEQAIQNKIEEERKVDSDHP